MRVNLRMVVSILLLAVLKVAEQEDQRWNQILAFLVFASQIHLVDVVGQVFAECSVDLVVVFLRDLDMFRHGFDYSLLSLCNVLSP